MSAPQSSNDPDATLDLIELTPEVGSADRSEPARRPIELIAGSRQSLTSVTTSLLHARLRAVAILLLVVFAMVFVWALVNTTSDGLGTLQFYQNFSVIRLLILGAFLAILSARPTYSQAFLRAVEYSLFGALTLLWIWSRYEAILLDVDAGNVTELLLNGRTSMIGLFLLMVVHGIFIPHRWHETARVVLTMALAPLVVLVLFEVRHPELAQQVTEMMSWRYVSTNILIVLVGAVLATYASHVLNNLRREAHDAKQFGQYQLVTKLGSGGMGDVFLAEHVLMKRPCALKLIRTEAAADPTALARFELEVKTTASLTHPHTIEIYDYGHTDEGTFYYVMEYLPGLSLGDLLAEYGPLPPGRVIYLLRQAARSALAEAHLAGLIHRDLKPGNLHISERGGLCDFVKVLDFGLVKPLHESSASQLTADHVVSGTPLYMAPEQVMGTQLDARSDVYALGAIAYHMLTGQPPFGDENPMVVMIAHARQEAPPISSHRKDVPDDLQQIVMRCLQKSPDDRYADASQLEQALTACSSASDWNAQKAAAWWHDVCFSRQE